MQNKKFVEFTKSFLSTSKGSRYDKAAVVYDKICTSDKPEAAFSYFMKEADSIESTEEKEIDEFFSASQLQGYNREYNDLIDGILNKLVIENDSEEVFYSKLWKKVFESDEWFEKRESKIYALGRIWSDGLIPYFKLDAGIKMSNEEYKEITDKNKLTIQKIIYILNYPAEQRTETGGRILKVLKECDDEKEKTVIISQLLAFIERRSIESVLKQQ